MKNWTFYQRLLGVLSVFLLVLVVGCSGKEKPQTELDVVVPVPDVKTDVADTVSKEDITPTDVKEDVEEPFEIGYLHPSSPAEAEDLNPADNIVEVNLAAEMILLDTPDGKQDGYAYNDQVPGPTIRAKVGDELIVNLQNKLLIPTTIHWHGVRVPWAMDGITWQQDPIASGDTFQYAYELNRAGTFWYHPHFDSASQVDLGLYATLVVEDPAEPKTDHELVLVFDGFGEDQHVEVGEEHTHSHIEGVLKNWVINGEQTPSYSFPAGTTVRVRMVNVSNTGYLDLRWPDMRQIGGDQGLLSALAEPTGIVMGPGDRAEVEWLIGSEGFVVKNHPYSLNGGAAYGDAMNLFEVISVGDAPTPTPVDWSFSGEAPSPDPGNTDVVYVFAGSDHTGEWLMNGETYPDITVYEIPAGKAFLMEVRNLSPTEHPFHLHGVDFEVLSANGVVPETKRIEDTINVGVHQSVRLRVVADNPGDWMAHCHILPHAHGGMMTVIRFLD